MLAADPEWWWSTILVFLSAAVLGSFLCINMFVALVAAVFSESLELDEYLSLHPDVRRSTDGSTRSLPPTPLVDRRAQWLLTADFFC